MSIQETWKDIPGFEGAYQVSDLGRVWSLDRVKIYFRNGAAITRRHKGRILQTYENAARGGYNYVNLQTEAVGHKFRVGCLVALAFLGPRPAGHQVCHDNGVTHDDRLKNLRYDTPAGNASDKKKHGTDPRGERHGGARLTEEDVRRIKKSGASSRVLSDELGVGQSQINHIRRGERWSHV